MTSVFFDLYSFSKSTLSLAWQWKTDGGHIEFVQLRTLLRFFLLIPVLILNKDGRLRQCHSSGTCSFSAAGTRDLFNFWIKKKTDVTRAYSFTFWHTIPLEQNQSVLSLVGHFWYFFFKEVHFLPEVYLRNRDDVVS